MGAFGTYFNDVVEGFSTSVAAMWVAVKHLAQPTVTIQYPHVKRELHEWKGPNNHFTRHKLYVDIDDCIGCLKCERACPVECISIETIKTMPDESLGETSTGNPKRLWVGKFDIDMEKCCYCGLCVYPCPTECIHMTDNYEYSVYNREDHIYNFGVYLPEEWESRRAEISKFMEEEAARKAAAKAKAREAKLAAGGGGEKPRRERPDRPRRERPLRKDRGKKDEE